TKPPELEERPIFQELAVKGELALAPNKLGSVKVALGGLELAAFAGAARKNGVNLGDGLLDADVTTTFKPDGALDLKVDATFTDLDVSESDNGPIAKFLNVGAPLGVILFVLRDEEGAIRLPLHVDRSASGDVPVAGLVLRVLRDLIVDAIKSSPLRA